VQLSGWTLALGLRVVTERELLKFLRQRERLVSALVRPLLWLIVFASGLHDLLGVSIIAPYRTYTPYQEYILPGLLGMVVLFQCMQSALSLVYDRESGVMRVMLVTPAKALFAVRQDPWRNGSVSGAMRRFSDRRRPVRNPFTMGNDCADHPCPHPVRPDAGGHRAGRFGLYKADREFRGHDEFRDLPDVLPVLGALPPVEIA
jgi:ABC-2 type transporter